MSEPVCLDTSYLVGLLDERDTWHGEATRIHAVLRQHAAPTITADCVVNETLTVLARRCRERGQSQAFAALADTVMRALPEASITWLYPHVPRWFAECVGIMRASQGALNFHDALLRVAAEHVGFGAVVSFDAGFDRVAGLKCLGSSTQVERWLRARRRASRSES